VPQIPDLTRSNRTDPNFAPHCSSAVPRRKPPGATFLWTLTLGWELTPEDATAIVLPPPFSRDRGDILAALAGTGPAYRRGSDLQEEVQVSIAVRVGQERVPIVENGIGIVKRMTATAAEGGGKVVVLLVVEGPQALAGGFLDCLDADLDVSVVTNEELFGGAPADEVEREEPEDQDDDDDELAPVQLDASDRWGGEEPEAETTTETASPARRRRRTTVEELPPEAGDGAEA
jgi:hypothetical protein